jgi:hypothetical protein
MTKRKRTKYHELQMLLYHKFQLTQLYYWFMYLQEHSYVRKSAHFLDFAFARLSSIILY